MSVVKDFHLSTTCPFFNSVSLVHFPTSPSLTPQFFIVLRGACALIPPLPLFDFELMYATLKTGKDRKYISPALNRLS